MIKAIFFDFNGVIIDDKTIVQSMFEQASKPLTGPVLENVLGAKTDLHRQMIGDELPLFPGVLKFLKAAAREYELGLVSMANKAEIGYVFQRANLTPLFSIVVTAEDASVCKPAP